MPRSQLVIPLSIIALFFLTVGSIPAADQLITPGATVPASAAPAGAWHIQWGEPLMHSWVVITPGLGRVQSAYVTSDDAGPPATYAVAYPAVAWRDLAGSLHIYARRSCVVGPKAFSQHGDRQWWPDSMVIRSDGTVVVQDDSDANATIYRGTVLSTFDVNSESFRQRRNMAINLTNNQQ